MLRSIQRCFRSLLRGWLLAGYLLTGSFAGLVHAEVAGPGWINQTASPVSPADAAGYYSTVPTRPAPSLQTEVVGPSAVAAAETTAQEPEITGLARALQNDALLIYEYVLNHIDYVPYYGHLKGASLTLLERSGNDFDQAQLLVALLRAAGHTAEFVHGEMFIPTLGAADQQDLAHWFDVGPDLTALSTVLGSGGIPGTIDASTTRMARVWVRLTTATATYDLDPAFKVYERTPGADIAAAMGYRRSDIMAAAGGSTGTDYVSNLNEAAIGSRLTGYANTLLAYLQENHPNSSVAEVTGGSRIRPRQLRELPAGPPFPRLEQGTWSEIPARFIHTVRMQIGSLDRTLGIPDIGGKRLSLLVDRGFDASEPPTYPSITEVHDFGQIEVGDSREAVVHTITYTGPGGPWSTGSLDLLLLIQGGEGAYSIVGPTAVSVPLGGSYPVKVRFHGDSQNKGPRKATLVVVADAACPGIQACLSGGVNLRGRIGSPEVNLMLEDSSLAKAPVQLDGSGKVNLRLTVDHKYPVADFADQVSDYTLKNDSTYVVISDFGGSRDGLLLKQRQKKLEQYRADGFSDTSGRVLAETLNVMGQTWMRQTGLVDSLMQELSGTHLTYHHRFGLMAQETGYYVDVKTQLVSAIARFSPEDRSNAFFNASIFMHSALEHGVLEQMQGADYPAASTIKLIKRANGSGSRIYRVDADNFAFIRPELTGYSGEDLDTLLAEVSDAATLLLPEEGSIAVQQWRGKGYVSYTEIDGGASLGMIIGGGYFGGFGGIPVQIQPEPVYNNYLPKLNPVLEIPRTTSVDPVDLFTGAYLFDHTDISIGGAEPEGLRFVRYYNSDRRNRRSDLGYGWTHHYAVSLNRYSDAGIAAGLRQPRDAVALLVASQAAMDLLATPGPLVKEWVTAALVSHWVTGQLLENAVAVEKADQSLIYLKLPDGSYSAPPGVTTTLVKDGSGLYSLRERFGRRVYFDADNRISSWSDADGNSVSFSYGIWGLESVRNSFGHSLTLQTDGTELQRVTDSTGRFVEYSYDQDHDLTEFADTEGKTWSYSYIDHRMVSLQDPLATTIASNTYDSFGRVDTQTVPRDGGTVSFNFYYSDFRNIEENPDGFQTVYFFDKKGRNVGVQDALGNTRKTGYDGQNQVVTRTDAQGNTSRFVYDGHNNLHLTINALSQQTENRYDVEHRLTDIVDPLNHVTHYGYDSEHHLILTRNATGNETSVSHYANGRVFTTTDGRNTLSTFTYDGFGYPDTSRVASHPVVDHDYDPVGRLTRLVDQEGAITVFQYDRRGLVTEITDPLLRKTVLAYDDAGRLESVTDRNSDTIRYEYTPLGKLRTVSYPDDSFVKFSYTSAMENRETMTDALGVTRYGYDGLDRLTSQVDPHGFAVAYSYDEAGNLVKLVYPGNRVVTYDYDALNRIKSVSIDWLGQTAEYFYDAAGRLDYLINFNGAKSDYSFDDANRMVGLVHTAATNGIIASVQYPALDGNGNRITEIREEAQLPLNLAATMVDYSYNEQRNRLDNTTHDVFVYDAEGQTISKSGQDYSWDFEHRLTGVGGDRYFYDGAGNRLKATRDGLTTKYLHDGSGNLLAEADNTGGIKRYYIHGLGMLAFVQGDEVFVYHHDPVGSTLAVTDASGVVINAYSYTPYGVVTDQQESIPQPFKYVGQHGVMAEPNGLYYMRARYYDPETGRFISEDPIGFEGGLNLYAYANGNPNKYIDPEGTFVINVAGAVFGAVNGGIGAFISSGGKLRQTLVGATVGAAGGLVAPASAIGTALVGFGSSIVGQTIGGGSVASIDYGLATASAVGGVAGRSVTQFLINPNRSASAHVITRGLGRANPNAERGFGAVIGGSFAGTVEKLH